MALATNNFMVNGDSFAKHYPLTALVNPFVTKKTGKQVLNAKGKI